MRLCTTAAVREHIQLDSIDRLNSAIDSSATTVTSQLEGHIRTPFDRATVADVFLMPRMFKAGTAAAPVYHKKLALSRGFLTGAPTLTYASSVEGLSENPETLSTNYWRADLVKGWIQLLDQDLSHQYLKVAYTAGFTAESDPADLYAQAEVPTWLQQTALQLTVCDLLSNNPDLRDEDTTPDFKGMKKAAFATCQRYIRYFAMADRPAYTE